MRITKAYAQEVLNNWKNRSALYGGTMTAGQLESALEQAGIKQADRVVIEMALRLAGAKFAD